MVLRVEGEIRRRVRSGLGPFARSKWQATAFDVSVPVTGERVDFADDLSFLCVPSPAGWVLQGKVSSVSCMFGEIRREELGKGFAFTMLSVSGREVSGKAKVVPLRQTAPDEEPAVRSPRRDE